MYEIELKNLTKRYNDKLALDNVSVKIEEGEIFGLLGPNGAGKTTLIHLLCGLIAMDSGEIEIGKVSMKQNSEKLKKLIGYVPQDVILFESLSITENLDYFGRLYHLSGSDLRKRMEKAMEVTGLLENRKQKVKKLSGGMKRRVNIACAIMHSPKILVLDEPTVGVDPHSRNHILEFIRELNHTEKTTVVYTSHYMEEAEAICDRLLILDLGKELVKGTKKEIIRSITDETVIEVTADASELSFSTFLADVKYVKKVSVYREKVSIITDKSENSVEEILKFLAEQKINIRNISINNPTLETVFLSITGKELRD